MKRARPDDEGVAAQQAARPHTVTRPGTRGGAAAPSPSRGGGGEFVEDLSFLAGDVLGAFLASQGLTMADLAKWKEDDAQTAVQCLAIYRQPGVAVVDVVDVMGAVKKARARIHAHESNQHDSLAPAPGSRISEGQIDGVLDAAVAVSGGCGGVLSAPRKAAPPPPPPPCNAATAPAAAAAVAMSDGSASESPESSDNGLGWGIELPEPQDEAGEHEAVSEGFVAGASDAGEQAGLEQVEVLAREERRRRQQQQGRERPEEQQQRQRGRAREERRLLQAVEQGDNSDDGDGSTSAHEALLVDDTTTHAAFSYVGD